jgi:hypothetical protein
MKAPGKALAFIIAMILNAIYMMSASYAYLNLHTSKIVFFWTLVWITVSNFSYIVIYIILTLDLL